MDGEWLCGSCRSINRPRDDRCYSCRQARTTSGDASGPPDLQELARRTGSTIVSLPSVPDAMAILESFGDIDVPATLDLSGATDPPGGPTFHLTPDKWLVASDLPVERIDALVTVSTPIWQLIEVARASGAGAAVLDLNALLERRTIVVRLSELGRAVDRIASVLSPFELGRLAEEGEEYLGRFTSEVPHDADPALTALANGVDQMVGALAESTVAMGPGSPVADATGPASPMATYVWCYRTVASQFEASARGRHS
jgi:hypothetical protein